MPERVPDVAIVGGGISGLAAAHTLQKRGVAFVLVEAGQRWGGVIRTESAGGFLLEGGPDAILAQKPEGIGLCRELGLEARLVPTNPLERAVYVLHHRRLHPLPEGMMLAVPTRILPFLESRLFSWPGKLRMGLDLVIPPRRGGGDESIASFLRRRFGEECVERLGEPLLAGIHSGDPERLSMRASFPRFLDLEARHGSLIRGMWAAPKPKTQGPPPAAFYSLVGGLGEMVDALVARLPGDRLKAGRPVRSLARDGKGFALALEGGERVHARAIVLALPARAAAPLVGALAREAGEALSAIPFASSATLLLGYRRQDAAHPLDGYGLVVPKTEGLRTTACSFVSTKFPGRAPAGHVLLRAFLGGVRDPGVLALDDADLVSIATQEMAPVLGLAGQPVMTRVFRWPEGTPQMEVGHQERIAAVEQQLAQVPGLFLTGAGVRGVGVPDCVADGTKTAAAAAEWLSL